MSDPKFKIIDWTDKLKNFNERIFSIVLHHTCSDTVESTINGFKSGGTSAHFLVINSLSVHKMTICSSLFSLADEDYNNVCNEANASIRNQQCTLDMFAPFSCNGLWVNSHSINLKVFSLVTLLDFSMTTISPMSAWCMAIGYKNNVSSVITVTDCCSISCLISNFLKSPGWQGRIDLPTGQRWKEGLACRSQQLGNKVI